MQYPLLIYETAADFARRDQDGNDATYVGAWRAYYKAVVEAGMETGDKRVDPYAMQFGFFFGGSFSGKVLD